MFHHYRDWPILWPKADVGAQRGTDVRRRRNTSVSGGWLTVRLVAGSRSVEAKALAETEDVTIALVDRSLNEKLRTGNFLEVRGEGTTLRVPLDGSAVAFGRLDGCFDKNSREGIEANPFVAPDRRP